MASGNRLARPSPTSTKPPSTSGTEGTSAATSIPTPAVSPPAVISRAGPSLIDSQVPASRPAVIAEA